MRSGRCPQTFNLAFNFAVLFALVAISLDAMTETGWAAKALEANGETFERMEASIEID